MCLHEEAGYTSGGRRPRQDRDKLTLAARRRAETARLLVRFAHMTRDLKGNGLDEGASTRLLVHAAKLMHDDIDPVVACQTAIAQAITDDHDMLVAMNELSSSLF